MRPPNVVVFLADDVGWGDYSASGFPLDLDSLRAWKTGLLLIEGIAEYDLHGEVRYLPLPEGGRRVSLTFPLPKS
jgi:hypothetical protein